MIKFAPHISIYDFEESRDIQNEVIWTFSSYLKGFLSVNHRVNIIIVPNISEEKTNVESSIKSIWKYINKEEYCSVSRMKQKEIVLNLISDSLIEISEVLNLNMTPILQAKESALSQQIKFKYSSKLKMNNSRKISANIDLKLNHDKVEIWVSFLFKNSQDSIKKHLIDTTHEQIAIFRKFEEPIWLSDNYFGFKFKNGMTLSISPSDREAEWSELNTKQKELFVREIDFNQSLSHEERVKLMNW